MPKLDLSDSGSQLVSAGTIFNDYLNDDSLQEYLNANGIQKFSQYPKGCNQLGGSVESCVKFVKSLIYGSIRNNVLEFYGFV